MYQLRLFTLKCVLLRLSEILQTEFSAETRVAEQQSLKEQLNMVELRMSQVGT